MFLIAICRQLGDKWQSKTLFLSIFDLYSSLELTFSNAAYPVWAQKGIIWNSHFYWGYIWQSYVLALKACPCMNSKICIKRPLSKRPQIDFQDQLLLNAGQKYCRMLHLEHSAILSTFIKVPFVIKIFVLCIFDCQFYTGFTVFDFC